MMTSRKIEIDAAKGLGILIISIYHLVYRPENGIADIILCECIWLFIPFFFLLSGFNFKEGRTISENINHRLKALLFPALKYTAVILFLGGIYCIIFHGYSADDVLKDAVFTYLRPEFSSMLFPEWGNTGVLFECLSPVWFVWTMILSFLIFYPAERYALKSTKSLCVSCAVLLTAGIMLYGFGEKVSWSMTATPVYAAIMLCGVWLSREQNIRVSIIPAVIALAVHGVMYRFCGNDYAYASQLGTVGRWSVIPFFIQTFIGGYVVYVFCNVCPAVITKVLAFVGRNSFRYLMLHGIFSLLGADIMQTFTKFTPDLWYVENLTPEIFIKSLIVWVISVICCTLFCVMADR